jgi:hypothetical protein
MGNCSGSTFEQQAAGLSALASVQGAEGGLVSPVFDYYSDANGYMIGDYAGEIYCPPGLAFCTMWDPSTQQWQAANNGTWLKIKNIARKIGKYIPVPCGAGVFAYGGATVGSPASVTVAKWGQWDTMDGSSSGLFTELSGGEGVSAGVGGQATPGQNMEYYGFLGTGSDNPGFLGGSASAFLSSDFSSSASEGFALEGTAGRSAGGVGAYLNFTSLTRAWTKSHSSGRNRIGLVSTS